MKEELKGKSSHYQEWDSGKGMCEKHFGSLAVCCVLPPSLRQIYMSFGAFWSLISVCVYCYAEAVI